MPTQMARLAGIVLLIVASASATQISNRFVIGTKGLDSDLADEAGLLFRRLDADGDARVSPSDVRAREDELKQKLPDVSVEQFVAFIETADQDGDKRLDRDEMVDGFSLGLLNSGASFIEEMGKATDTRSATAVESKSTVAAEIEAAVHRATSEQPKENKKGKAKGKPAIEVKPQQRPQPKGGAKVDESEDACILCQYVVERIVNNVHWAGVLPMYRGGRPDREGADTDTLDTRYMNFDDKDAYDALYKLQDRQMRDTRVANIYKQPWSTPPIPAKGYPSQYQYGQVPFGRPHNQINLFGMKMGVDVPGMQKTLGGMLGFIETGVKVSATGRAAAAAAAGAKSSQAPLMGFTGGSQFAFAGAGKPMYTPFTPVDPTQPGYRSWFSALERQKYSEIYHVADLTLDHVCEAAMPNEYYKHCKTIFDGEGAIVNLISRQFSVQNICRRLQMCGSGSYITRMIHTPHSRPGPSPFEEAIQAATKEFKQDIDDVPMKEIRERAAQTHQPLPPMADPMRPFQLDAKGRPIPEPPKPFP